VAAIKRAVIELKSGDANLNVTLAQVKKLLAWESLFEKRYGRIDRVVSDNRAEFFQKSGVISLRHKRNSKANSPKGGMSATATPTGSTNAGANSTNQGHVLEVDQQSTGGVQQNQLQPHQKAGPVSRGNGAGGGNGNSSNARTDKKSGKNIKNNKGGRGETTGNNDLAVTTSAPNGTPGSNSCEDRSSGNRNAVDQEQSQNSRQSQPHQSHQQQYQSAHSHQQHQHHQQQQQHQQEQQEGDGMYGGHPRNDNQPNQLNQSYGYELRQQGTGVGHYPQVQQQKHHEQQQQYQQQQQQQQQGPQYVMNRSKGQFG